MHAVSEYILHPNESRKSVVNAMFEQVSSLDASKGWVISIERQTKTRSAAQNRLQQKWHLEAAQELKDESAEDKRAYCKLHLGVPILRAENREFREQYDRVIRPMDYQTKLALMKVPFDFPVTRLMTVEQKTRYLDAVWNHYTSQGVRLTAPELQGVAA